MGTRARRFKGKSQYVTVPTLSCHTCGSIRGGFVKCLRGFPFTSYKSTESV